MRKVLKNMKQESVLKVSHVYTTDISSSRDGQRKSQKTKAINAEFFFLESTQFITFQDHSLLRLTMHSLAQLSSAPTVRVHHAHWKLGWASRTPSLPPLQEVLVAVSIQLVLQVCLCSFPRGVSFRGASDHR